MTSITNFTVKNCEINNFNRGIYLGGSSNKNKLINNTVNNNAFGIYLKWDSDFNDLINNKIINNADTGVYFTSGANNNTLTGNLICGNVLDVDNKDINSGDNNTCDNTNNWDDYSASTTKCGYVCGTIGPQANSTDDAGAHITIFDLGEGIYVKGGGFDPGDNNVTVCIVNNTDQWYEGMTIPDDVRGGCNQSVPTDGNGNIYPPVRVWGSKPGYYDIVVDQDQDGYYNDTRDAVNNATGEGFHIYSEPLTAVLVIVGLSLLYGMMRVKRKR